ncbi:MAG: hypothetical protein Q9195_003703 [Heterodermia aff. obscurata]
MDFAGDYDEELQDQAPQQERPIGLMDHAFGSSNDEFNPPNDVSFSPFQFPDPESRGLSFLNRFAKERACLEGFPTSHFIGSFGFVTKAGVWKTGVLPIMYRCVWPPGSGSRHTLLHMTASMDLKDLGRALDLAFKIVDTGGAVASTEIVWARSPATRPNNLHSFSWEYSILGQLKNGIVEVHVESIPDALTCACGARIPEADWTLKKLRARYDRRIFKSVCLACLRDQREKKIEAQKEEARQDLPPPPVWDP